MEICFHGNQLSWGNKHPLINLWSKNRFPAFICLSTMLAPVISSLDEIYCIDVRKFMALASYLMVIHDLRISCWRSSNLAGVFVRSLIRIVRKGDLLNSTSWLSADGWTGVTGATGATGLRTDKAICRVASPRLKPDPNLKKTQTSRYHNPCRRALAGNSIPTMQQKDFDIF